MAAALPASAGPPPLNTAPGFTLGAVVAAHRYLEPGLGVSQEGALWGAAAGCTLSAGDRLFLRAGLDWAQGRLRYQGSGTLDGVPDSRLEARLTLGRDFSPSPGVALAPYAGLGLRLAWNDLRGTTSSGARGYRREAALQFLPLGCTLRVALGGAWVLAPAAEVAWVFKAREVSRFSDAGQGLDDAFNRAGSGQGRRLAVLLEHGPCSFGPWLQTWEVGASDQTAIGRGFTAQEPLNRTREAGLTLTWRFGTR